MPYKSVAQLKYMHAIHPDIAEKWDTKYPVPKNLKERIGKIKKK